MPMAVFILVGLAGLALTVSRFSGQSSIAAVQEVISVQAFYAAESGAQFALNRMFYDTAAVVTRGQADSNCTTSINGQTLNFSATGLNNCSADLMCTVDTTSDSTTSFYTVTSVGACGSGDVTANRTVVVSSFIQ